MTDSWRQRAYTVGEAANLAGINRATLDVWCGRLPAELFSGKRGHRRWFSPQDIAVIALAHQLERGGQVLLTAIGCAFEHLQEPPAPDAILVVPAGSVSSTSGRYIADRDVARLPIDKTLILIPAGAIVARITAACASLRERAA